MENGRSGSWSDGVGENVHEPIAFVLPWLHDEMPD